MRNADFAVIVGAYQAESTIDEALASLADQSVLPDLVVVVDDASTDATLERAAEWSTRLPLELVRHEENRGHAASIQTALERFPTRRFAIFDADDVALPEHVEHLLGLHRRFGGVVSPDALLWWPSSERPSVGFGAGHPRPVPGRELLGLIEDNWLLGVGVYDRSAVDGVGGFRDLPACYDWDLNLRLALAGEPLHRADRVTMLYRQHGTTVSKGERADLAGAEVLAHLAAIAEDREVVRSARRGARRLRRAAAVQRSYRLAREGRHGSARRSAVSGLTGGPRTAARAAAMLLAPGRAQTVHDRLAGLGGSATGGLPAER